MTKNVIFHYDVINMHLTWNARSNALLYGILWVVFIKIRHTHMPLSNYFYSLRLIISSFIHKIKILRVLISIAGILFLRLALSSLLSLGSEQIKSKFIAGNAEFSWSFGGDSEQSIFVTRNDDPGNWSDANQPYTVKDALNFSSIEVDVKILDSMKKEISLCRGLFSGTNKR